MEKLKNYLKDLSLFLSAFVPMFILILFRLVIDMLNHNLSFNFLNSLNFITLIILIICGILGLLWNIHSSSTVQEIEIISKENITDKHFFGYFSLFVLFALQFNLSLVSGYFIFIVTMIFIGIVYIKNSLYYINPLLNIMGYNFYDIVYTVQGDKVKHQAKIFHKGDLDCNKNYSVAIKNQNFTFVNKKNR